MVGLRSYATAIEKVGLEAAMEKIGVSVSSKEWKKIRYW